MFKKIFIFDELNYFVLINAIILRILRQKVYFLRLKKVWQNEKSIKILNFLGLNWLNFQDYEIKKTADEIWALSEMTLPHSLVRIIIIEQLYRAWSIISNHPYHRE